MSEQHRQCQECRALVYETKGRMVILDQESPTAECEGDGFHFLCIQCIRDWRERGLRREGLAPEEALEQLDKEYPFR
jgi:hypothetical protein